MSAYPDDLPKLRPAQLPAQRRALIEDLIQRARDAPDQERGTHRRERAAGLRRASLWWVSPQMTSQALLRTQELPEQWNAADYAPDTNGLLWWDSDVPLVMELGPAAGLVEPETAIVRGFYWQKGPTEYEACLLLTSTEEGTMRDSLPIAITPGHAKMEKMIALIVTTWICMLEPSCEQTQEREHVTKPKKGQRKQKPATVNILTLRRLPTNEAAEPSQDGRTWQLQNRITVRRHPRNQRCGPGLSETKTIWVEAHQRGPKDAPPPDEERVHVWRR